MKYMLSIVAVMLILTSLFVIQTHKNEHEEQLRLDTRLPEILQHRYSIPGPRSMILAMAFSLAARTENLDVITLVAMAGVESSMNCDAVSHDGSRGLMGVQPKFWQNKPYNAYDCYENILQGAFVLREYFNITGNIGDAIRAYNVGITSHTQRKHTDRADVYLAKVEKEAKILVELRDAPLLQE